MAGIFDWYRKPPTERLIIAMVDEYKRIGDLHREYHKPLGEDTG